MKKVDEQNLLWWWATTPEYDPVLGDKLRTAADLLNIPEKRLYYLIEKWSTQSLVEWGVSCRYPWKVPPDYLRGWTAERSRRLLGEELYTLSEETDGRISDAPQAGSEDGHPVPAELVAELPPT